MILYEFKLKEDEKLVISAEEFNGEMYYHIRIHFLRKPGDDWLPTKRGVAIKKRHIPEFFMGILELKNFVEEEMNIDKKQ